MILRRLYRYGTSFYLQFPTGNRKRRPFLTQRTLGELGRVCNRRRFILRIPLFYSCTLYYIAELLGFKIIIMSACIRDYQHQNVLGFKRNPAIPRPTRDEVKFYRGIDLSATRARRGRDAGATRHAWEIVWFGSVLTMASNRKILTLQQGVDVLKRL